MQNQQSKRMRLGTKSCAECRRRKVRCIFEPDDRTCQECLRHDTACLRQDATERGAPTPEPAIKKAKNVSQLQQQLDSLEDMVRHLCQAVVASNSQLPPITPFSQGHSDKQAPLLELITHALSRDKNNQLSNSRNNVENSHESEPQESGPTTSRSSVSNLSMTGTPYSQDISFDQAPLLKLLKNTLTIRQDQQFGAEESENSVDHHFQETITALKKIVPRLDDLILILELTEKYWCIWPVSLVDLGKSGRQYRQDRISLATDHILENLESDNRILISRTLLWLALCVQQLPADVLRDKTRFSTTFNLGGLQYSYLKAADSLLASIGKLVTNHELIECHCLRAKLNINLGRPGEAWLDVRNALNTGLLLGLNRQSHLPQNTLWKHIWELDRTLSATLGVPYAISDAHYFYPNPRDCEKNLGERIGEIAGLLSDRNLRGADADDHSSIISIEGKIDECWNSAPTEWRVDTIDGDVSFESLYNRQTFRQHMFTIRKMLYLPYLLKSLTRADNESARYRMAALTASKQIIHSYQVFRNSSQTAMVMCDTTDFLAFSGALVLVIDLLSRPPDHANETKEDWSIIERLIATLKRVSRSLNCIVSGQAATLLDYLHSAHEGKCHHPDGYRVVIPFFGKVQIQSIPCTQAPLQSGSSELSWLNEIEFSINSSGIGMSPSDVEIGTDWSLLSDSNMTDDWTQAFYGTGYDWFK